MIAIHSTVHPRTVRKLAERATAKGVTLIDAALTQQLIQRILISKISLEPPAWTSSGADFPTLLKWSPEAAPAWTPA